MKDGSIIVSFEKGEITRIAAKADLDPIYREMFLSARRTILRSPDKIRYGIQAIVFGCFWLEARSNNILQHLIAHEVKKDNLRVAVWKNLKRLNLLDKVKIISALAIDTGYTNCKVQIEKVQKTIDIRNRLAHCKEEEYPLEEVELVKPDSFSDPATESFGKALVQFFDGVPDPNLMIELKAPKISEHIEIINTSTKWIDLCYKNYCRSINIKVSRPKL